MAMAVTVIRGFLKQDDYHSTNDIEIKISDGGILQIITPEKIRSYAPGSWKTVTSRKSSDLRGNGARV